MTDKNKPEELSEEDLETVQGAGLLLPAVQTVRAKSGPKKGGSKFIGETEKNLKVSKGAGKTGIINTDEGETI